MIDGKTALITGAVTDIGRATALRLAREGVNLTINYSRSEKEAHATRRDCEALGVQSLLYSETLRQRPLETNKE